MVRKKGMSQKPRVHSKHNLTGLSRRAFLKVALASVGVLALPTAEASSSSILIEQTGNNGFILLSTFNPTTVQDNWVQPWEWNANDWPGQQLHLNVVEHAAPVSVFGEVQDADIDVQEFLFSYNGISPGPTIRTTGDNILPLKVRNMLPPNEADFCRPENMNTKHQQHTTNFHTHGLHVQPSRNPDGTFADNVLLRILPQGDYTLRKNDQSPACWPLRGNEVVGEANYQFRLGKLGGAVETHPPGTHWYHPHPHGATHDQVASGMAGFLIVEGDVDECLQTQIPGYAERLIFIQRVRAPKPKAPAGFIRDEQQRQKSEDAFLTVNGQQMGQRTMVMKPGAIERWRVLNGSVDGQGYVQFMVVEGLLPDDLTAQNAYLDDLDKRQILYLLAYDGLTLVRQNPETGTPEHYIKPLDKDKTVLLAPANRADFLFQAPDLAGQSTRTFTVVAKYFDQAIDLNPDTSLPPNIVVATLVVRGDNPPPALRDIDLTKDITLPPVPTMLHPITDEELTIPAWEANARGNPAEANKLRTRQLIYSGWGQANKYGPVMGGQNNTMAIDCQKYDPEIARHSMLLNTAEEWTIWNCSWTVREADKTLNAVDHPFHIHINPFWVLGMFDENGTQIDLNGNPKGSPNYDFEPRWQDTVRLPRNGGRTIFRQRYWDFTGEFVNHCHILLHEDNGMMQMVQVVANVELADYVAKNEGYQADEDFTVSREEAIKINLNNRRTCQRVLLRLRKPT